MLEATLRDRAKGLLTASGRSDVPPFMVMDVMAAAARIEAAGGHVIHMEVGQPAAPAPKAAISAARAALDGGRIDYTSALGIASLRERIARHYREAYGCAVDAERIVVTTGSSGAFILGFLAMFEPGDRVAVTVPGYPPYRHILTALGCEPVLIETSSETRHALTGEALLAAHRKSPLKGVLVGSPANPTGTMMSREALTSLIAAAEGAGIRFISDEIYHGLDYAFPAVTAAELSPHALVINSFSKYFCMTGWRVGWMVVPEPLVRPIERLQQNLAISVPTLSQIAAEAAFEGREEMEEVKRGYQENRRILIAGLPQAGLNKFLPADGAFYLYADVSEFTSDSFDFAKQMLEQAHVAATPGIDFDPVHGHRYIRFSYARSADDMREAVARVSRGGSGKARRGSHQWPGRLGSLSALEKPPAPLTLPPIDFGCRVETAVRASVTDRSGTRIGGERHGGNDRNRSASRGGTGKALVQDTLCSGADRDRARRAGRLAVARPGDQRLDQGARRRLHQADQDGDRADHLLHGGLRHLAHPGRQEGRPRRRQGAGLFRGRLDLRADHRPGRRQSGRRRARAWRREPMPRRLRVTPSRRKR